MHDCQLFPSPNEKRCFKLPAETDISLDKKHFVAPSTWDNSKGHN